MTADTESERDYQKLDRYLRVAFEILEGIADVETAEASLRAYLEREGGEIPEHLQAMLNELLELKRERDASPGPGL